MRKRILVRALVMLLSTTIVSGALSIGAQATQSVSFNGLLEGGSKQETAVLEYNRGGMQMPVVLGEDTKRLETDDKVMLASIETTENESSGETTQSDAGKEVAEENVTQEPEYPLASELDLFALDWRNASDDKLNHYLGMTEWRVIGQWISSMTEEELQELLKRDSVLVQETVIEEPDAEPVQMLYYEYALQKYKAGMMTRAYPTATSGYWKTNIVQVNAVGTPVRTAVITFKVSGVDTSVPTSERQSVTIAKSVTDNWCDITWSNAATDIKSYRSDAESNTYPHVRAIFEFKKPAGYKVSTSYNLTTSFHKIFWNKSTTFNADSMFLSGGTLADERYIYPEVATCNGISTAPLVAGEYAGVHKICSIVNMYVNAGIGTTAYPTKGNLVQTITLLPITYNVNYNGNGSTGGAVSAQSCSYDVNYTTQPNGFQREYTVTYDGNGGIPAVASQKASYAFKGWGWNQSSKVSYAAGATYKNLTAVSGGTTTMYALWNPVSIKLPAASKTGYTFTGWNIGNAGASYTPTTNVTAIAKWTPNSYKVVFQSAGGSECPEMEATYDKSITLPTPERAGYEFNGWKSATGTHVGSVKNLTSENGGVVTLVADWTAATDTPYAVRCYKQPKVGVTEKGKYVLFELKNGDPVDGEYVQYGTTDTTVSVSAPKIEGYVTPSAQSVQIAGDGSSIVNFYYNLETNEVTIPTLSTSDEQLDEIAKKIAAGLSFSMDVDGVEYEIAQTSDGTLGIRFISTNAEKIVIPDVVTIGNKVYRITEIQSEAFKENTVIKEVELSANISQIGDSAFEGCTSLQKIVLREGLVNIGSKAFSGCTALKKIELPKTVQDIGNYAFQNCTALSKVTLNDGLLKIGKKAFSNCAVLKKVSIPKTVLQIDAYAFEKCKKLENVTFVAGSRLLSMGTGVFSGCSALKKIKLPAKLTSIPTKAFYGCKKLKSVTGGASVTQIGAKAFSGCSKLTKYTVSSKVQSIGNKAFYQCKLLKKVQIKSKALTSVGSKAFKKCKKGMVFVVSKEKKNAYSKLLKGKY